MKKQIRKSGFTLVEILIVVVILGILAAIVVPQFSDASTQAKESSLVSDLQTMRSQIQLYKIQHSGALPGAGTASFTAAMTGYTTVAGAVGAVGDYGPYMQKIPTNQFNDLATIEEGVVAPGAGNCGWNFNTSTGAFHADDTAHAGL